MKLAEITNHSFEAMLENGLSHSDYICHYGVLGMKWKKRKAKSPSEKLSRKTKFRRKWITGIRNPMITTSHYGRAINIESNPDNDFDNFLSGTTKYIKTKQYNGTSNFTSGSSGSRLNSGLRAARKRVKKRRR